MNEGLGALIWAAVAIVLIMVVRKKTGRRRRFSGVGTGAADSIYDLLNEDKRKAVETFRFVEIAYFTVTVTSAAATKIPSSA